MASHGSESGAGKTSHASSVAPPVPLGSVIANKYRVDQVLNSGGMGVILIGHHVLLDQPIAVKMLRPSALENAELVARFAREARAAAKLKSEHVARVIDVGQLENGAPYMVMEYLDGTDLSRMVKERGALPLEEAIDYVLQACQALAEAHGLGIVHRDLKPANLFVTRGPDGEPMVKVLDFGISKVLRGPDDGELTEALTQTSMLMGSPHYMSPEQLRNAKLVDARSDVWSMGAVLFKLVTGINAFDAATTPELCVQILMGEPRKLDALRADMPRGLGDVIAKCLAKDADARFASVSELAVALEPFAHATARRSVARIGRVLAEADSRRNLPDARGGRTKTAPSGLTPLPVELREQRPSDPSLTTHSSSAAAREVELGTKVLPKRSRVAVIVGVALGLVGVVGVAAFVGPRVVGRVSGGGPTAEPTTSAAATSPPAEVTAKPPSTAESASSAAAPSPSVDVQPSAGSARAVASAPAGGRSPKITAPPATAATAATPKATATAAAPTATAAAPTASGFLPEFGGRK